MNVLEQMRVDLGLSVPEVAKRTGLTKQTIYNAESGTDVRVSTLKQLADLYELRPSELLQMLRDQKAGAGESSPAPEAA